jgi:hypothetical protein
MNWSHRHWENDIFLCSYARNKKLNELQPSLSGSLADGQRHRDQDEFIDSLPLARFVKFI